MILIKIRELTNFVKIYYIYYKLFKPILYKLTYTGVGDGIFQFMDGWMGCMIIRMMHDVWCHKVNGTHGDDDGQVQLTRITSNKERRYKSHTWLSHVCVWPIFTTSSYGHY